MDCSKTENYLSEKLRMTKRHSDGQCRIKCADCPLSWQNNGTSTTMSCITFEGYYPKEAILAVQKWSDEHPQRTYLIEFLKNYPNAELDENDIPKNTCPARLGLKDAENNFGKCTNCIKCWNTPVERSE